MPQPSVEIVPYLSTPLPPLRESYPPGQGGTGPRQEFNGSLKSVGVLKDLSGDVEKFLKTIPTEPLHAHPTHKYPKFVQAMTTIPQVIKSPADLQTCLSTLPLNGVASMLTTLDCKEAGVEPGPKGAQGADAAGYESDGGEEAETRGHVPKDDRVKPWYWQYNKSPMGSGEFLLMQKGSDKVHLVVRTVNSAAFSGHDWEEYVVAGPYRYNTKSKASWYWSRSWSATKRLDCQYFVLTDWQRWAFGTFDEKRENGYVSQVFKFDTTGPSVMQALFYWARTATGDKNGFKIPSSSSSSDNSNNKDKEQMFPDNPARRGSISGGKKPPKDSKKIKTANESDIEESDAEDAAALG